MQATGAPKHGWPSSRNRPPFDPHRRRRPRDLTAARKYLVVYLRGAHDATVKFADLYARNQDAQARDDYLALLDDLDQNFAARTAKSLLDDRSDLNVEIDVLRERLSREGVRLEQPAPANTKEDQ